MVSKDLLEHLNIVDGVVDHEGLGVLENEIDELFHSLLGVVGVPLVHSQLCVEVFNVGVDFWDGLVVLFFVDVVEDQSLVLAQIFGKGETLFEATMGL